MNYPALQLLIDGAWIDAGTRATGPVLNPATGEEFARVPFVTDDDLDAAIAAADRAFKLWRKTPAVERSAILHRAASLLRERCDEVSRVNTLEQGKPLDDARWETLATAEVFDWAAEEGRRISGQIVPPRTAGVRQFVVREPVGPVAGFSPWNGPALLFGRKVAEALAAGCSVIMKPAEETPATALMVARTLVDAGLPAGVLNIVFGVPSQVSTYLIGSPVIRKVSFTGSVEVGRILARLAADKLKRITLELGGHAPVLVFDDADVEKAAQLTVATKFRFAGQVCTSPTRFLVHESVHDDFLNQLVQGVASIKVGDGLATDTQMGPLANARRLAAMEHFVTDAIGHGARVETGGRRLGDRGFFFEPTVLSEVSLDCDIMNREPFGPVIAVRAFSNLEEAISEANRLPYGLAAYAFTRSPSLIEYLVDGFEAGLVGVNTYAANLPEKPFGGVKDSGYGVEGGREGVASYLTSKSVAVAV